MCVGVVPSTAGAPAEQQAVAARNQQPAEKNVSLDHKKLMRNKILLLYMEETHMPSLLDVA